MESEFFREAVPDFQRFPAAGFVKAGPSLPEAGGAGESADSTVWTYSEVFSDGDFRAELRVWKDGHVEGTVIDLISGEEYLPLRVAEQTGPYVSTVRYEYEKLLRRVFDRCFTGRPGGEDEEEILSLFHGLFSPQSNMFTHVSYLHLFHIPSSFIRLTLSSTNSP